MTEEAASFRATLLSLWLRLITVAIIGLLFALAPLAPSMVGNWRLYQTPGEIVFGFVVRIIFVALIGVALGSLCAAISFPFLLRNASSRLRIADLVTKIAVGIAAYLDLRILADTVIAPLVTLSGRQTFPLTLVYSVVFALALFFPRSRKQIVTSLDGFLGEKTTRRTAIGVGVATAGVVAAEWTMGKAASFRTGPVKGQRPSGPNILLVTFDALTAEDMSLYRYRLPTTPNIDAFAAKSSVFTNFYSASTFTSPSIASILTGVYPTEHRVFHLQGRISSDYAGKTLPALLRAGGYTNGASIQNPYAYCVAEGLEFDFLPFPPYREEGLNLWGATRVLHQRQPYGSRAREFSELELLRDNARREMMLLDARRFARTESGYPPARGFAQAREVMKKLPEGHFMWVHLFAPHEPYLPDAPWIGRFLPKGKMMAAEDQAGPMLYSASFQPVVDQARLRYDEFIAEADSAFGDFMSEMESAGKLRNTAVVVAADHGESFEGGVYRHANSHITRPQVHVPLIIRMPGQHQGNRVSITADQTSLAPTILDIAGLPRPKWMRGQSLIPSMSPERQGDCEGLAFSQYLEGNTIFEPVRKGTIGVIDAQNQYMVLLASGRGILRSLAEAHLSSYDNSAQNPALAQKMRSAICSRFPYLPINEA